MGRGRRRPAGAHAAPDAARPALPRELRERRAARRGAAAVRHRAAPGRRERRRPGHARPSPRSRRGATRRCGACRATATWPSASTGSSSPTAPPASPASGALAAHFGRLGLDVELQVRYHPRPQDDGDLATWLAYVRRVVRAFGPNRHVTGLQITNEVNLTFSPNTSDGAHRRAVDALVRGVIAAKRESRRLGFHQQRIGFNYAFRFGDRNDAGFWDAVGRRGGARCAARPTGSGSTSTPGPSCRRSRRSCTSATRCWRGSRWSASATCRWRASGGARRCGSRSSGFPTGPNRPDEAAQARALDELVRTAVAYRGTYGLTDLRWFSLRDNTHLGPNFQSFFGLLHDDYTPKPAFATYRGLIRRHGARR